jgi:hypothetical protein
MSSQNALHTRACSCLCCSFVGASSLSANCETGVAALLADMLASRDAVPAEVRSGVAVTVATSLGGVGNLRSAGLVDFSPPTSPRCDDSSAIRGREIGAGVVCESGPPNLNNSVLSANVVMTTRESASSDAGSGRGCRARVRAT